ncbi:hypothetical protein R5R35_012760 [Gryllus longicercus]
MTVLHVVVNAQDDDTRYVEIFPGKCYVHDEIIISKLELHPQGDDTISSQITGILSLANQLPCETQIYRYVYYWAPVGAIEMNVTSSLESAQSAAGPELESMGLPVQCPVPPGDYPLEWAPAARSIMSGSKGRGRMVLGFDAFDRAGDRKLASCRFSVSIKRDD